MNLRNSSLLTAVAATLLATATAASFGQEANPATTSTAPATTQSTSAPAATQPVANDQGRAINFAQYAESTSRAIRTIETTLADDERTKVVDEELPKLDVEVAARATETSRLLTSGASLDTLRTLERDWNGFRTQLADWSHRLASRIDALGRADGQLVDMQQRSQQTIDAARRVQGEPELLQRVEAINTDVQRLRDRTRQKLSGLEQLQGRITVLDVRVSDMLRTVRDSRSTAVGRLFDRDSLPLWESIGGTRSTDELAQDGRNTFANQRSAAAAYVSRRFQRVLLHLVLVGLLASGIIWVRKRWLAKVPDDDPAVRRSISIFAMPIPMALVVTLPFIPWLYPQGPRLFMAIMFGGLLIPAVVVLRQLVMRPLLPLLYALVCSYLIGLAVSVTASLPTLSRTIFFAHMTGGLVFLALFIRHAARSPDFQLIADTLRWRIVNRAVRVGLVVMLVSALANLFGFVSLANLLGRTLLISAYLAIILDAGLRVIDALILGVMQIKPIAATGMVRHHGTMVRRRAVAILSIGAAVWWALTTLEMLSLRQPLLDRVWQILAAEWGVGAIRLSLGGILAFAAVVTAAFLLSRITQFILTEDVYPRVHLARGVPNAISTLLHYVILFGGFLLAVGALGYDMTKFTILAGAFGVGLGFGMQNIVNNFVSGLILLFERPIQVGDVIELDAATVGLVARIGIRASVIRLPTSAEVIVPNGILIAGRVTNWTLSNRQRGFEIEVTIPAGGEPERAIPVMTETAKKHPGVSSLPAPRVSVEFAAAGALKLQLHVWTDRYDNWLDTKSDLVIAIDKALAAASVKRA